MRIGTTRIKNNKYSSHVLFKIPSYNIKRIKIYSNTLREKVHCSQVSNGNKNRLDHEYFNQIHEENFCILALKVVKTNLID